MSRFISTCALAALLCSGCVHRGRHTTAETKPVVAPETVLTNSQNNAACVITNSSFNTENYIWDNWSVK